MQKGTKTVIRMDNTRHISDPFELITLENILSQANMLAALKRVEANKGAPGIDGMETTQLREHLFLHPGNFRVRLETARINRRRSKGSAFLNQKEVNTETLEYRRL